MVTFEFNPTADFIVLTVKCPECGSEICQSMDVPSPDFSAETHRDSVNQDSDELYCDNCGKEISVILYSGYGGGDGEIDDIDDEDLICVDEHFPEEDWEDIDEAFYDNFIDPHVKDLSESLNHIEILIEPTKKIIYRNFYANVISCMEAYLSDTAIKKIMQNDVFKRNFVKSSPYFKDLSIKASNIYDFYTDLDKAILIQLREIIYHKLGVIKPMYKSTFGIDIGEIRDLMNAVQKRHDIVHRNGHDKDGSEVQISKEDVENLITDVSNFIQNIETQFGNIQSDNANVNANTAPDEITGLFNDI